MLIPNNRPKNIENYTFSGRDDDALKILFFAFSDIIFHWINWIFTEAFNFRIFPKDKNVDTSHPVLFEMPIKVKNSDRHVMHLSIFIPVLKNLVKSEFVFSKFAFLQRSQEITQKKSVFLLLFLLLQQTLLLYLNWFCLLRGVLFIIIF